MKSDVEFDKIKLILKNYFIYVLVDYYKYESYAIVLYVLSPFRTRQSQRMYDLPCIHP